MRRLAFVLISFWLFGGRAERAYANGAFPDSMGLFLPSEDSNRIILTTNFGLLISNDRGATWRWVCEQAVNLNSSLLSAPPITLYQLGPEPERRLHAVSTEGVFSSSDGACSWRAAIGTSFEPTDVFADPSQSTRVWSLNARGLYQSNDGAMSFQGPVFSDATHDLISVESSKGNPQRVYATLYHFIEKHPYVARSDDGGTTWKVLDALEGFGNRLPRILTVDPNDENFVFFRLIDLDSNRDSLAISNDGGKTMRRVLELENAMTAFLRRQDGSMWVGQLNGGGFVSNDATNFERLTSSLHFKALAERDGVVYAVADNTVDGFALGVSKDDGTTFVPLLKFDQLTGKLLPCGELALQCAGVWQFIQKQFGIGSQVPTEPAKSSGCACVTPNALPSPTPYVGSMIAIAFAFFCKHRKQRKRRDA